MKKFNIPSFPVSGRFDDQRAFAEQSREFLTETLEDWSDMLRAYGAFGVVRKGFAGGYLVDFVQPDCYIHPVSEFVCLLKPEEAFENATAFIRQVWAQPPEEEEASWRKALDDPDFRLADIPVSYLFETEEEARQWLWEQAPRYYISSGCTNGRDYDEPDTRFWTVDEARDAAEERLADLVGMEGPDGESHEVTVWVESSTLDSGTAIEVLTTPCAPRKTCHP